MADNLIANEPNFYVWNGEDGITFAAAGYNAGNTSVIFERATGFYKFWKPVGISSLSVLTLDKGYLILPLTSREDTNLIPPIPEGAAAGEEEQRTDDYADQAGATVGERALLQAFTATIVENDMEHDILYFAPIVGNSAANKKYDMWNPANPPMSDIIGTPANHAKGLAFEGEPTPGTVIDEVDTHFDYTDLPDGDVMGWGFYSPETIQGMMFGAIGGSGGTVDIAWNAIPIGGAADLLSYVKLGNNTTPNPVRTGTEKKHWLFQRLDGDTVELWNDGVKVDTITQSNVAQTAGATIHFNLRNPSVTLPLSCIYVVKYLNATKVAIWNTAIETLMVGLGRDT